MSESHILFVSIAIIILELESVTYDLQTIRLLLSLSTIWHHRIRSLNHYWQLLLDLFPLLGATSFSSRTHIQMRAVIIPAGSQVPDIMLQTVKKAQLHQYDRVSTKNYDAEHNRWRWQRIHFASSGGVSLLPNRKSEPRLFLGSRLTSRMRESFTAPLWHFDSAVSRHGAGKNLTTEPSNVWTEMCRMNYVFPLVTSNQTKRVFSLNQFIALFIVVPQLNYNSLWAWAIKRTKSENKYSGAIFR